MGQCAQLFRITWHPVVLSFSFTSKELRADPWATLRNRLEQLDVKYIADYDIALTTHVVSKKRNTSKGLQALINGRYIVTDTFITAIADAAASPTDGDASRPSPLERDFDGNWPDALQHLPPRGEEPSDRPAEAYAPDRRRQDIFDAYTFIFYDKKQYDNLIAAISNGKGKALLREATPGGTQIDDFIRYVKEAAGEKGLGEFEDGSEGRGVVVVRYLPDKGDHYDWFAEFMTAVSLRLDHRMIDQREFLDAILSLQPAILRRPLETEPGTQPEQGMRSTEPTGRAILSDFSLQQLRADGLPRHRPGPWTLMSRRTPCHNKDQELNLLPMKRPRLAKRADAPGMLVGVVGSRVLAVMSTRTKRWPLPRPACLSRRKTKVVGHSENALLRPFWKRALVTSLTISHRLLQR